MFMSETAITTRAPQRLQALERANEIRLARAELKRQIACGQVSAAEVILDPPCAAQSWAIGELLMSQRRWGNTRCRKFLVRNQIGETKTVGALTERQRRLLALQLSPPAAPEPVLAPADYTLNDEAPVLAPVAQESVLAFVPA
jgi:hypothetical protein